MGQLVVVAQVSLDGVIQSPGRPDEDTRDGFTRGGWASSHLANDPAAVQAGMSGAGQTAAFVFGHRTYLDLVGHWLTTTEPNPFTEMLRQIPKHVASRNPVGDLPHPHSHWLEGDACAAVAELKAQTEGDLVVLGSGSLVRDLAAADLVDAYGLTIIPVVLGSGRRLFADTYATFDVTKSSISAPGAVVATYRVRRA